MGDLYLLNLLVLPYARPGRGAGEHRPPAGKNGQEKNLFQAHFATTTGFVLVPVVDPATAEGIVGSIIGLVT